MVVKLNRERTLVALLALVLALDLIVLVFLLAGRGESQGPALLRSSADGGTATVFAGSQPTGREDGPPAARREPLVTAGQRRDTGGSDRGAATGDGAGQDDSTASTTDSVAATGPGPSGTDDPGTPRGGDPPDAEEPAVSLGDVGVGIDLDDPSATVSIGDTKITLDPGSLLP